MLTCRITSSACALARALDAAVDGTRIACGRAGGAAAILLALVVASPAIGAPHVYAATTPAVSAVARPDLKVTAGTVRASGGRLSGSFTVRNVGRRAGRSYAGLTVWAAGKRRVVARFAVPVLKRSAKRRVKVKVDVPQGLPAGSFALRACADSHGQIRERSESNNCRTVGKLSMAAAPAPAPLPAPGSSFPTHAIPFEKDTVFTLSSPATNYWLYVPADYATSHLVPTTLLVWLHGCGGFSEGDIYTVAPVASQNYIAATVGGREGSCWDVESDSEKVLATIADIKTHFNIAPRRVVLGGYSSGGDLTYRVAFYNAKLFAGVLVENSSPFRDTGSSQSASLSAATWRFNIVHLAHLEDATYPIDGVRAETDAVKAAGFPLMRIERPGTHYDADTGSSGTDYDLRTYLLPHLSDGWLSPE